MVPTGTFSTMLSPSRAGFVGALPVTPALGLVFGVEAEVDESVVALARFHYHVATMTAVATRRTSARYELLAPEGHAAIAAVASFHSNSCFVNEHGKQWLVDRG